MKISRSKMGTISSICSIISDGLIGIVQIYIRRNGHWEYVDVDFFNELYGGLSQNDGVISFVGEFGESRHFVFTSVRYRIKSRIA